MDEWEIKRQMEAWNSPEKVALDEYTSIIQAHYEHVLRPIVQRVESLDRDAIEMVKSDLEWHVNDPNFAKLPLKLKRAYQTFHRFTEVLEKSDDNEVKAAKAVLQGLFRLGIACHTYGNLGSGDKSFRLRNPCRDHQYETLLAIKKAERKGGSQLLKSAREMFDVCKKCPYK